MTEAITMSEQKKVKSKIEDVAAEFLDGDNLKNILDLIGFLKDNELTPRWDYTNRWSFNYKSKKVCYIAISGNEKLWTFSPGHLSRQGAPFKEWFADYNQYITDDELKEFVWSHLRNNTIKCKNNTCEGIKNITILGKEFDRICFCWTIRIPNLNGAELECAKKLILVIKTIIADLAAAGKA